MRHSITISLSASTLRFHKDSKSKKSKFEIGALSLAYRTTQDPKYEYIISDASVSF